MFTILRQMPFIACRLCDKIKAVYKYYTGAKTMERQRFLPLLAVIIFIWVLWRYEAALALLGFFCNLIMPFISAAAWHLSSMFLWCISNASGKTVCTLFFRLAPKNQTSGLSDLHPNSYYWHRSDRRAQNWPRSAPKL